MRVLRGSQAPVRQLPGGETRQYLLDDQIELIITHIPPGHEQPFHRHLQIVEVTYVMEGEVVLVEGTREENLTKGDAAIFSPRGAYHAIVNRAKAAATTLTIKLVPDPKSKHEVFAADKESMTK